VLINDTHDPHVMPALDAGIHVLLSFPIALARAEPPSALGRNAAYSQI
jgi:predicted dehydrogenase